ETAKRWRLNLERGKRDIMPVLRNTYGDDAAIWYHRWRLFFLACEELFGYRDGLEWAVSHYRLAPTTPSANVGSTPLEAAVAHDRIT
ncbi:MAG: hypothetical protein AAGA20_16150, partial [Planctomycetota bacterium]